MRPFVWTQPQVGPTNRPDPQPTYSDVAYGPHERHVLDFYQAKSGAPTAVILYFHGGGFVSGDKREFEVPMLPRALRAGLSFAMANYRFVDGQTTLLPAPQQDGARAVQFLRSKADAWNLAPSRIAAFGGSAGAGIAVWIAFHDDLANPASRDPVERQSSRLQVAGSFYGQTTYDPAVIREAVGGRAIEHPALPLAWGRGLEQLLHPPPELQRLYDAASPVTHLTADDPPLFMVYTGSVEPLPSDSPPGEGVHHAGFGRLAKVRMDALGLENVLFLTDQAGSDGHTQMLEFFLRHLGLAR